MKALALGLIAAALAGCGTSEVQTMPNAARTAAPATPPYLANNPNLPESAKKGIAGAMSSPPGGSPSAGK